MLLRKESLKKGFRIKQDISMYNVDELVVCVEHGIHLRVYVQTMWDSAVLSELELPSVTMLDKLMCTVTHNHMLYIREKLTEAMELVCSDSDQQRYLPVLLEDEMSSTVKCIWHVPDEFTYDDVYVKTVDEQLVVMGHKQQGSPPEGCWSSAVEDGKTVMAASATTQLAASPMFKMILQLPEGVDSRTVSASLSYQNQLLVTGALGSSSRRYTC